MLEKEDVEQFLCIKETEVYKNYKFDKEEIDKIKVDISFIKQTGKKNEVKLAVQYVLNEYQNFPDIKHIIFILKRFLQINNLNSSFNGINNSLTN